MFVYTHFNISLSFLFFLLLCNNFVFLLRSPQFSTFLIQYKQVRSFLSSVLMTILFFCSSILFTKVLRLSLWRGLRWPWACRWSWRCGCPSPRSRWSRPGILLVSQCPEKDEIFYFNANFKQFLLKLFPGILLVSQCPEMIVTIVNVYLYTLLIQYRGREREGDKSIRKKDWERKYWEQGPFNTKTAKPVTATLGTKQVVVYVVFVVLRVLQKWGKFGTSFSKAGFGFVVIGKWSFIGVGSTRCIRDHLSLCYLAV